jgi:hypothetical protein
VRAKNQLVDTLGRAAAGRSRRDAIVSMPAAYRTWALEHPDRCAAAQRASTPALRGFVTLETSGSFGLLVDIGRDFEPFVRGFDAAISGWTAEPAKTSGPT